MATDDPNVLRANPASPEAERSILGGLLLDSGTHWATAAASIQVDDFSLDSHRRIYRAIEQLVRNGHVVDIITLVEELRRTKEIESVGGVAYLASLTEGLPRNISIVEYATIVRNKAILRDTMRVGTSIENAAADQSDSPSLILEAAQTQLRELTQRTIRTGLERVSDYFAKTYASVDEYYSPAAAPKGVLSPFAQWNAMAGGFHRKELIIIAARPSMGKTAMMTTLCVHLGVELRQKVAVFSLEQPTQAILDRMVCARAGVAVGELRGKQRSFIAARYAQDALSDILEAPIYIDDDPMLSAEEIVSRAEMLSDRVGGLDAIMVDYLQYLPSRLKRGETRTLELGNMTKTLRGGAKRLNVPLICLAQVSRETENRADKKPRLADLRESGDIEQNADVVAFIHRPEYYDKDNEELAGLAEFIIAKQRNGPIGTVHLRYRGPHFLFTEKAI